MFARKSTSQLICSIFRSQCLRASQHHTSLSQWLQICCYTLSFNLRHKSQNPFPWAWRWISTSVVSNFTIWRCWSSTSVWGVPALGKWGGLGKGELPASYPQDISVNCIYVLGKRGGYLYELYLQRKREDICCGICPKPHFLHSPEGSPDLTRVVSIVYRT